MALRRDQYNYSTFSGRKGVWLEDIYIRPELRKRGVGSRLVEWSMKDWNTLALDFYRRIGSHLMDDRIMYRLDGDALANMALQH